MSTDIVVTIPKNQVKFVEKEERDVAAREAAGEVGIIYYWRMGKLPKEKPDRIFFLWNRAIRAWHHVIRMDESEGRIYMTTKIHELANPMPMKPFMGFRYLSGFDQSPHRREKPTLDSTEEPIGWQITNRDTDCPPVKMMSFEVIRDLKQVLWWIRSQPIPGEWRICPIWEGDIEEPKFIVPTP